MLDQLESGLGMKTLYKSRNIIPPPIWFWFTHVYVFNMMNFKQFLDKFTIGLSLTNNQNVSWYNHYNNLSYIDFVFDRVKESFAIEFESASFVVFSFQSYQRKLIDI